MATLLSCKDICYDVPTKSIFKDVTLGLADGDRVGVVGRNGDGKSSLVGILAQTTEPDSGQVTWRGGLEVGVLAQRDALKDDETVIHAVVGSVPEHEWAGDPRIRNIMSGLLHDIELDALVGTLSGGQRHRVDLARVLTGTHDVIMLDEPTNGLDMGTIRWLANHLNRRWAKGTGALLVVTHDRWFLDEVCTQMWEVHDGRVEPFTGGYSAYVLTRVEREKAAQIAAIKRNNLLRRELAWLSRGARARATKPKFHVEAAEALIADVPPKRETLELSRSEISRLGKDVIELKRATKVFEGKTVLDHVDWLIGKGDRIGILGENGAGKSTLLDLITGKQRLTSGVVKIGKTVRFATLSQQLTELEPFKTSQVREVLSHYKTTYVIDGKEVTPAKLLERLGFSSKHLNSRVCDLSGGQQRRLQLMLTLIDKPNVLLLDEPGNDMDTDMLSAIEDLLEGWPGTMILVTHDRYLMERVTDDQYALIDGQVRHMPGGVDEYLALLDRRAREQQRAKKAEKAGADEDGSGAKPQAGASKLSRAELHDLRMRLGAVERKLAALEQQEADAQALMAAADPTDFEQLAKLQALIDDARAQTPALEDEWVELTDKLEG